MFTIIRNLVNGILTWCERRIAYAEGYNLYDTVDCKLDMDYIVNGK